MSLPDKFHGALIGGAIGDALGVPTEKRYPIEIKERYGEVRDFVAPWHTNGDNPRHRGDGNVTDDTLMTVMICRVYLAKRGHIDAHDAAIHLVPLLLAPTTFVPEYGREMPLIERLFYAEKYLYHRLALANCDPREGGQGNMVNCGAAMCATPVGLMNAADPAAAYREAIDFFAAHQWSYGREAAGVMAACVAAACAPNVCIADVCAAALSVAKDGTARAIAAALHAVEGMTNWRCAINPLQQVLLHYMPGGWTTERRPSGQPSRDGSIEEQPAALALLQENQGAFTESVIAATNYGHDSDSIAIMAGSIAGALCGAKALPESWKATIVQRNRIDFASLSADMVKLFGTVVQQDYETAIVRRSALNLNSG